jgi:uncharacterized protein (TIGR02246 family)
MKANVNTQSKVAEVLNRFAEGFANQDADSLLDLFAPDSDLVFVGTGPDEKRVGKAEIKAQMERNWSQSEALSVKFGRPLVTMAGPVALVAADPHVRIKVDGQEVEVQPRLTAALEERGGKWLIVQWHWSMPVDHQDKGESFFEGG